MADRQSFHYLSSQDQIKPEYWESFEPIFTDYENAIEWLSETKDVDQTTR